MKNRRVPILTACLAVFQLLAFQSALGKTIYVSKTSSGGDGSSWQTAFTTISDGLAAAESGDQLWITMHVYTENIALVTNVSLYGGFLGTEESPDQRLSQMITDIQAASSEQSTVEGADGALMDHFFIWGNPVAGLQCTSASPTIVNCEFCGITGNTGVTCHGTAAPVIRDCTFRNHSESKGSLYCTDQSAPTLVNCTITGNRYSDSGAIYCINSSSPALIDCSIEVCSGIFKGGAITCEDTSTPTISNCILYNNNAYNAGGIYCAGEAAPIIENCTIDNNTSAFFPDAPTAGGVGCFESSSPIIRNCTISNNSGGGIISADSSTPDIDGCYISGFYLYGQNVFYSYTPGAGVSCVGTSAPTIRNCQILDNESDSNGAGIHCDENTRPLLTNCIISGNTVSNLFETYKGAALYCGGQSSPTLINCTVTGNGGYYSSGNSIYCETGSTLSLINSILWNGGTEITGPGAQSTVVNYSCIPGGWPGEGNVSEYPQFQRGTVRYDLRDGSMCVDSGLTSVAPDRDILGRPRPGADGLVDMGAYESPPEFLPPETPPPLALYVKYGIDSSGDGTSWELAYGYISSVLGKAVPGSEIWVSGGNYEEAFSMKEGVAIYGGFNGTETEREQRDWNVNKTVIRPSDPVESSVIGADDAILDGFTIEGSLNSRIVCRETSPAFANCIISGRNAPATGTSGIHSNASSPKLINCIIEGNDGQGLVCYWNSRPELTNCTIVGNTDGGIVCSDSSAAQLTNCILWNPGAELREETAESTVEYSCLQGGWPGDGNLATRPLFIDAAGGDYQLQDNSPCIDQGSAAAAPDISLNGLLRLQGDETADIGAYETPPGFHGSTPSEPDVYYVNASANESGDGASWESAFNSINKALRTIATRGEVWVAQGSYREPVTMEPGVGIYAGFLGTEGQREDRDWAANATMLNPGVPDSSAVLGADDGILDGFIITGASQSGVSCFKTSPILCNCSIFGNTAVWGGGIYCNGGSPVIDDCRISQNQADYGGGMYFSDNSFPAVTDCLIENNTANTYGGGIYTTLSSPNLTRCIITQNQSGYGGGTFFSSSSSPALNNCIIADNAAAEDGGGAYALVTSAPSFKNCTLYGNHTTAENSGGGISCFDASPELLNCILWNNTPAEIVVSESLLLGTWSDIRGGFEGTGNIDLDPQFSFEATSPVIGLRLNDESPCIDTGNPDALWDDACLPPGLGDVHCDMGAFGGPQNCGWLPENPYTFIDDYWVH